MFWVDRHRYKSHPVPSSKTGMTAAPPSKPKAPPVIQFGPVSTAVNSESREIRNPETGKESISWDQFQVKWIPIGNHNPPLT